MTTAIDLSRLPPPTILDNLDFEAILAERKSRLLDLTPEDEREDLAALLNLESEPLTKFLEESAYRELLLRQTQNERARSLLLAYAAGAELDHIGVTYYRTDRLTLDAGDPEALPPVPPTLEADRDYRRRILLAQDSWSTAGPKRAYEYWALSAHADVKDANASTPAPGEVLISVLSRQGSGAADLALLDAVREAVNDEWVAPQTDLVSVQSASIVVYECVAALEVYPGPDPEMVRKEAVARVTEWIEERHRLGASIIRDALLSQLYVEGVRRVMLSHPATDIECAEYEAAHATEIEVSIA